MHDKEDVEAIRQANDTMSQIVVRPMREGVIRGRGGNVPEVLARGLGPSIVKKPHIADLLTNSYNTVHNEIQRLHEKSQGDGLTPTEIASLERLVNSLRKLAAEERDQHAAEKLDEMMDDEVEKKAAEVLKRLSDG